MEEAGSNIYSKISISAAGERVLLRLFLYLPVPEFSSAGNGADKKCRYIYCPKNRGLFVHISELLRELKRSPPGYLLFTGNVI